MGRRLPCGSALFASLWRAIQSQSGRLPFLADGFLPLVYLQRFTASAHTRPAEASAGPLADTSRPICPGLGRRAGLPARRPRLAALERWRAGFSFSRPRGGGGSSAIAGGFRGWAVLTGWRACAPFDRLVSEANHSLRFWGSVFRFAQVVEVRAPAHQRRDSIIL